MRSLRFLSITTYKSAWTEETGLWTTSELSVFGEASSMRISILNATKQWRTWRPALTLISNTTTRRGFISLWTTTYLMKCINASSTMNRNGNRLHKILHLKPVKILCWLNSAFYFPVIENSISKPWKEFWFYKFFNNLTDFMLWIFESCFLDVLENHFIKPTKPINFLSGLLYGKMGKSVSAYKQALKKAYVTTFLGSESDCQILERRFVVIENTP